MILKIALLYTYNYSDGEIMMKKIAKWGFGFAPQKKETLEKRTSDIKMFLHFMLEVRFSKVPFF